MNLINEQSVAASTTVNTTTTTLTSSSTITEATSEAKELSPVQARRRRVVRSSLESSATTKTASLAIPASSSSSSSSSSLSLSFSSLPSSPLTFSSLIRTSSSSSSSSSSSPLVESINRQIEKISNTISSADAYQINLIRKMPATTTTTMACAAAAAPVPTTMTAASNTKTTTVNMDSVVSVVSDVSDCLKNKNGDKTTTPAALSSAPPSERERKVGCEHYKRRAMFVTPCCNKFYKCRYCHDENETHHFDRKTLTELICVECNTRQKVQEQCEKCGVQFGKYTCLICNLFDDEDKNQYHCDGCGICRIGGRNNFFHCEVCNMCLPIELKIQGHRCVENISRSNCPVCLGAIHTSRIPCHIPDCGHLLHKMCFDQLLASGHYVCPTCQTSLLDMTKMWEYLDAQALLMAVPKKYENQRVYIFCNDCHETCKTKFHFVGLKCIHCGGYNTTQDVKRRMSWANGADSSTSA